MDLLRAVEVARLDALQCGLWDQAIAGDPASCAAVVRIIDQRVRLLGIVGASLAAAGATAQADVARRTVVQVPREPGGLMADASRELQAPLRSIDLVALQAGDRS